jgi:hypothetical protein
VEAGANFEAQTDSGERPLHLAIQRMDINTLLTLLDAGVDKEAPAALVWDSDAPLTPTEMAHSLPKAVDCKCLLIPTTLSSAHRYSQPST